MIERSPRAPAPAALAEARVVWEATRACDRACPDCPLGAGRWRDPRELSTIEAMLLINRLRARGCAVLSLAGGDPTRRDDLEALVRHAARLGVEVELTIPGGVVPPGAGRLERLREVGVTRVVVRPCAVASEDRSAEVAAAARAAGLPAVRGAPPKALTIGPTGEVREGVPA